MVGKRLKIILWVGIVAIVVVGVVSFLTPGSPWDPWQWRGKELARTTKCLNNIHQIGVAMVQYAGDHNEEYPPSMGVLLHEGYLTTTYIFICPSSKDRDPDNTSADWKNLDLQVLDQVEQFGSYAYVKGLKHENRPDVIVLYDKPGHHKGKGRNCFFDDGTVKWLQESEFEKQMKEQEHKLRELREKKAE